MGDVTLSELSRWLRRHGASWNGVVLTPGCGHRGYSVRSCRAIQKGDCIARIPKSTVLSVRTASAVW